MKLKNHELRKEKKIYPNKSLKPWLIFQIYNLLNPRLELNKEYQFKEFIKVKKIAIKNKGV
jgi:hypothetical protein